MAKENDDLQAEDVDALADAAGDIATMLATLVEVVTTMRRMQQEAAPLIVEQCMTDELQQALDQAEATVDTWLEEFAEFMEADEEEAAAAGEGGAL